jgi:transposase-like protein
MPKPQGKATEVVAKPENDRRQRRRFSAAEKQRILEQADACTERGQLGELLRREGIYASLLAHWRARRAADGVNGLENRRTGPPSQKEEREHERALAQKDRRIAELEREVRIQKALLDLQVKAHEILGEALPRVDDSEMSALQRSSVERTRKSR